jgi:hypothetical protein
MTALRRKIARSPDPLPSKNFLNPTLSIVMPAQAGIQSHKNRRFIKTLDPRLRGHDGDGK